MATVEQIAAAHYRRQTTLARRTAVEAGRLWRHVEPGNIAASWTHLLGRLFGVVSSAQGIAAASAGLYVDDALEAQGVAPDAVGRVRVDAFAGVASDGRDLARLLYQPAISALTAIGAGSPPTRALAGGRLHLDMLIRTQIADAGRVADGVAIVARPQATGYVRMLSLPSCARCIILAGRTYSVSTGFQRHPRCDCRHIPVAEDTTEDLRTDPRKAFQSMDADEQDRVFTRAGAEAIRLGADLSQVVNARSGMYTAGGHVLTRTGTTRHGLAGQRLAAHQGPVVRRMPEQLLHEAGSRDEAIRLLRRHGFIL